MTASVAAYPPCPSTLEATLPPKLDINVGAKYHFFQTPALSAVETLQQSNTSIESEHVASSIKRKRSRPQHSLSDSATPRSGANRGWTSPSGYNNSPAPFVNTQYRLAGGLDTPTAALSTSLNLRQDVLFPDHAPRGGCRSTRRGMSDEYFTCIPSALSREANGRPRLQTNHAANDGWRRTIYGVIGAAGKVWRFCKTFRGFYAGKGPGYAMTTLVRSINEETQLWHMDEKDWTLLTGEEQVSIPGRFPEDFIEDYMTQDHTTPPRAAKKIQRSKGEGNIRENWVMVGRSPTSSRDGSPVRLSDRKLPPSSASGRRPMTRTAKRLVLPADRPSLTSQAGSPRIRSSGPASFPSTRSPGTNPKHESPVSADVQRHAARIRRRELEEDANLKRFNQQLKAMIRQGKEALGTTVEVAQESYGSVDEGYIEGEIFNQGRKG